MRTVRFVGLDVHKASIAIAVAEEYERGQATFVGEVPNDVPRLIKKLRSLQHEGTQLRCCYEAGPTGVVLQRRLTESGIDCIIVAPSQLPTRPGERVKTDRLDAQRLARALRNGDVAAVHVSDEDTEAMKDLSRAREDALEAKQRARQQLSGFLLRHGRAYPSGKKQGTKAHLEWAKRQEFATEAQQRVLRDYVAAYEAAQDREKKLSTDIEQLVETWKLAPLVHALCALRGVQLLTATTVAAEIGDFQRFGSAPQFASFLGLAPSEDSTGERQVRGSITKAGNSHVRRVLIEAAWNYQRGGSLTAAIRRRGENTIPEVRAIAQKAQDRLYRRWKALQARGKDNRKVVTAIARELACFIWAIGRNDVLLKQISAHERTLAAAALKGKKKAA